MPIHNLMRTSVATYSFTASVACAICCIGATGCGSDIGECLACQVVPPVLHTPQICVFDSDTLEDVGTKYGLQYKVQRLDYTRSLKYRVARLKAILAAANTQVRPGSYM